LDRGEIIETLVQDAAVEEKVFLDIE
jgi:hypothetical protein